MSQVYVSPNSDIGTGTLSIIVVILILVTLGIMAYSGGWISMRPTPVTPIPGSNVNMTLPASPATAPDPTSTLSSGANNYQLRNQY